MNEPRWRPALRAAVIAAGLAVVVFGLLQLRAKDGPIYIVFALLSGVLLFPSVEVLPRVVLAVADLATTIGFLYIGGLPIIVVRFVLILALQVLRALLPGPLARWFDLPAAEPGRTRRVLFAVLTPAGRPMDVSMVAEWATFAVGLAVRWWIASALAPGGPPVSYVAAIAVAEIGGYACWFVLAQLPIYPDHSLVPVPPEAEERTAFDDIRLIVILALAPFVFLITYGYQAHGLSGAVAWSLSSLGLHFVLKRLHERRLRLEEQHRRLETLHRELEHRERLSAIGKMSSVVSHQILQQIGVIGLYADLIRNADADADPPAALRQAKRNAGAIEEALDDVNRVLRDLLVFSRDLRLNLYRHPLDRIIGETIDDCRAQAEAKGVVLRADCPSGLELMVDKLKTKQALVNLLRNAIEASPSGGEVRVAATAGETDVLVSFSDQGPGVPAYRREAIFAPFFTTREDGTGLGLAIARVFVEAHGGRVWVEPPTEGSGARFVVRLPRASRRPETGRPQP